MGSLVGSDRTVGPSRVCGELLCIGPVVVPLLLLFVLSTITRADLLYITRILPRYKLIICGGNVAVTVSHTITVTN